MVYQEPDKELNEEEIEITPDEISGELDEEGLSFEEDSASGTSEIDDLEKTKTKGRQVNRHALEVRRKIEQRQELLRLREQFGDLFDDLIADEEPPPLPKKTKSNKTKRKGTR